MPVFKNGHNAVLYRKMKQFLQKYKYILILALILAIIAGIAVFTSISANEASSANESFTSSESSICSDETSLAVTENTAETTALTKPQSTTAQQTVKEETAPPETEIITQAVTSASQKPTEATEAVTTTVSTKASAESSAPQSSVTTKAETTLTESSATTKAITASAESAPPKKYDYTCLFEIECRTILSNMDKLSKDKKECVPDDGVLFSAETGFDKGESVYDILKRVCDENGIQLETSYSPAFATRYIEGIGNLYEFDCGTASGWMYTVNGEYMNYGCSSCIVSDGDKIAIRYTCNMGNDLDLQ